MSITRIEVLRLYVDMAPSSFVNGFAALDWIGVGVGIVRSAHSCTALREARIMCDLNCLCYNFIIPT